MPGGEDIDPSSENNAFHTNGNPEQGTRKKSRKGQASENNGNPLNPGDPRPYPGIKHPVTGRAPFDAPR